MFPEEFAASWIGRLTRPGQTVLDPFSGRGTAPFQALLMGRRSVAGDVNPVAYVLTGAKLDPPSPPSISRRLSELADSFSSSRYDDRARALPAFFRRAFHWSTLRQVLHLREHLRWRERKVDRFIAALALGSLHGEMDKSESYFSNQMPRTISTKPNYSLEFWKQHDLWPEKRNVFEILRARLAFRFESDAPGLRGNAYLADARELAVIARGHAESVHLVLTSPPYLDVTNFEEDQWLRLWFLGGRPGPTTGLFSRDDRHDRARTYWTFICEAWRGIRPLLARRALLVCRIGAKGLEPDAIRTAFTASLTALARKVTLVEFSVSAAERRQTDAFRPGTSSKMEADLYFQLGQ